MQYTIVREKRKSVSLTVQPSGEIVLKIPLELTETQLNELLYKHRRWFSARVAQASTPKLDYGEGRTVVLYGRSYVIKSGRGRIEGDFLYLPTRGRDRAFKRLLVELSAEILEKKTWELAQKYSFSYANVRISSAKGRWGSCSRDKTIAYTFRMCFLDEALCEYVIVHELCHTRYMNHGKGFWAEVSRCMPDWKQRRARLKRTAHIMNVLPF